MTQPPTYPGPQQPLGPYPPPAQPQQWQWQPPAVQPARGLAIGATVVAAVFAAAEVLEAVLAWFAQQSYLEAARNGESSFDVFTAYDVAFIPWGLAGVAAFIVTCLWLHRVRQNAEGLNPGAHHSRSSGWVWGGWIVPIVNFWFPFQVVRDVRNAGRTPRNALIGWWWAFWLLNLLLSQVGGELTGWDEIDTDVVRGLGPVETINAATAVIALALWLRIVWTITRDQEQAMRPAR